MSELVLLYELSAPICTHDHRDLHEHHRTLRLKGGRLIDELGWVQADADAA